MRETSEWRTDRVMDMLLSRDMSLSEIADFLGCTKADVLFTIIKFCNKNLDMEDPIESMIIYFSIEIPKQLPGLTPLRYAELVVEKINGVRKL
jgi:hypothetical protein